MGLIRLPLLKRFSLGHGNRRHVRRGIPAGYMPEKAAGSRLLGHVCSLLPHLGADLPLVDCLPAGELEGANHGLPHLEAETASSSRDSILKQRRHRQAETAS